jgi:hypothetical protein
LITLIILSETYKLWIFSLLQLHPILPPYIQLFSSELRSHNWINHIYPSCCISVQDSIRS